MVQCTRTRLFLSEPEADGATYICPYCSHHESYVGLASDAWQARAVREEIAACREEFGVADDGVETVVWVGGDVAECTFEGELGVFHIYLTGPGNYLQHPFQAGHEAFHRVCTPANSFHWAHEGLAVRQSLVAVRRRGMDEYANVNEQEFSNETDLLSVSDMLAVDGLPYPPGFYGRSLDVVSRLEQALGWDAVKPLALARDDEGRASHQVWIACLSDAEQALVNELLS